MDVNEYLPERVNTGKWLPGYTLDVLGRLDAGAEIVLPICSLGTPYEEAARLGDLLLPPLFHEALDEQLAARIVERIGQCFPLHELGGEERGSRPSVRVEELGRRELGRAERPAVLAFSVDTAVEEHGPHLPLATDTIQSYAVLRRLAGEFAGLRLGPPVEYGQLTWGLPFGFSIDLTAELVEEYVRRVTNAMIDWLRPEAIYVVDVHGSIVHRRAIVAGLERSRAGKWAFRWLYEPLVEFTSARGDQHAGGVETALVEYAGGELVDKRWWPARIDEIAAGQMTLETAVELGADLPRWFEQVRGSRLNGVVGKIGNYHEVDAEVMFERMLDLARRDVEKLMAGRGAGHAAGAEPW